MSTNFKGAISKISTKVFVSGPQQASKYDIAYKALLTYFGSHFDHRVHQAFKQKDKAVGLALLKKPTASKTKVKVEEEDPNDATKKIMVEKEIVDKDSEDFYEYTHELKKYVDNKLKYDDDIQRCFTIIMGQCSPDIE